MPVQLAAGLGLAYLLFQNIKGKAFFRIVYFLPYITNSVAVIVVARTMAIAIALPLTAMMLLAVISERSPVRRFMPP